MIRWRSVTALAFAVASMSLLAAAVTRGAEQIPGTRIQGGCDVPVSRRTSETGCYLVATTSLGTLPDVPLFWHLHRFQTRAHAEAAAQSRSTVVESLGYVWLYTIAEEGWKPTAGERVTVIGPLPITKGTNYVARYMEAVFVPGMQTAVHRHSGPEAWYVLAGSQCLETPDRTMIAKAGEGAVIAGGPPMTLSGIGDEVRRSVVLVLHDATQPWMTMETEWKPGGRCPQ